MEKPVVGQVLYSLNVGNAARWQRQELAPGKVTKVGRKYFTFTKDGYINGEEYHIDTWKQKTEYSVDSVLYLNPQAWEDEKEAVEICKLIKNAFEYGYNRKSLPLESLREIRGIIEQPAMRDEENAG